MHVRGVSFRCTHACQRHPMNVGGPSHSAQFLHLQPWWDGIDSVLRGLHCVPVNDRADRLMGCILGGALGDALGGPYENRTPPFDLQDRAQWSISDDTVLTVATCNALSAGSRMDAEAVALHMADAYRRGQVRNAGASTTKALRELAAGGHWALVGRKGEMAAGNGAAMRVAPLAFFCEPRSESGRRLIRDVARITHHSDEACCGALAIACAVHDAASGVWTGDASTRLTRVAQSLPDTQVRDRLLELCKSVPLTIGEAGARHGAGGFVVESVPLALLAASMFPTLTFLQVIRQVVLCGGDTDTNASMAGQIMGACLGAPSLPKEMMGRIVGWDWIEKAARSVAGRHSS